MSLIKELKLCYRAFLSNFDSLMYPYKLTFAITYKCNSKCKTCGIWKKKPKNEMTLDEIQEFSKKSSFFSWFNITGGEPFLRKDLTEIVETFLENSPDFYLLNMTTNGLSPDSIIEKTEEVLSLDPPRTIVVVSLDGPKEIHDRIRGIPGSWDKAIETYKRLRSLSRDRKNFQTYLGLTFSPLNVGKFRETYFFVKGEIPSVSPKDFHVNLYHSSNHYYSNMDSIEESSEYRKELMKELEEVESMKNENYMNPISILEETYLRLAKKFVRDGKTPLKCKAIMTSCFIDPNGNVFPCTIFNKNLGNLRDVDYDLTKILNSNLSKKVKKNVFSLKCPNCWTPCEAYQMIIGNWLKIC